MDVIPGRYTTLWFEASRSARITSFAPVLRHQPLAHDRPGRGHGASGVSGVARRRRSKDRWPSAAAPLPAAGVQLVPSRLGAGPRPVAQRHFRQASRAPGWLIDDGQRSLPARVDSDLTGEDRQRLSAADADVPGADQRRRAGGAHRAREIALAECVQRATGGRARAVGALPDALRDVREEKWNDTTDTARAALPERRSRPQSRGC